jgi:hypothetical protein
MSSAASRSPWLTIPTTFGLFFGGGYAGTQAARTLAPDSPVAEFVSFLALPAGLLIGFVAWAAVAAPAALRRFVRLARVRSGSPDSIDGVSAGTIPPGSFAFVPAALVTSTLPGMVVAATSTRLGVAWVLCLYAVVGLAYGVACWKLAQSGYLPFPRE